MHIKHLSEEARVIELFCRSGSKRARARCAGREPLARLCVSTASDRPAVLEIGDSDHGGQLKAAQGSQRLGGVGVGGHGHMGERQISGSRRWIEEEVCVSVG